MKLIITRFVTLVFLLQLVVPPVSAAEQLGLQAPDVEPPKILFDETSSEIEAGEKTFTATVTDNIGVATVTLYFKGATDIAFKPKQMERSSTDPNVYTAELYLDPVISNKLEIYVRADDVSGNSIFAGQQFSPLTFTVVPKDVGEVIQTVTKPPAPEEDEGLATWQWVLIGLGVAALAGGGGGGGGSDPEEPTTGTITITGPTP